MNDSPLTAADLKAIQQALYEATVAEREVQDLKDCGLECGEEEARCQHQKGFLTAVLAKHAPTPPSRASRTK